MSIPPVTDKHYVRAIIISKRSTTSKERERGFFLSVEHFDIVDGYYTKFFLPHYVAKFIISALRGRKMFSTQFYLFIILYVAVLVLGRNEFTHWKVDGNVILHI